MARKKSEFWEKYKHPKWQEKRLLIFQRDGFFCQHCGDKDTELHVHHKFYRKDADPWDYTDDALITFCKTCHESAETERRMVTEHLVHVRPCDSHELAGFMLGMALREKLEEDRRHEILSYEYADGVGRAIGAMAEEVLDITREGKLSHNFAHALYLVKNEESIAKRRAYFAEEREQAAKEAEVS